MTEHEWLHAVLVFGGVLAEKASRAIRDRLKNPYRWKCPDPGCNFKVATSDKKVRDEVVSHHIWPRGENTP